VKVRRYSAKTVTSSILGKSRTEKGKKSKRRRRKRTGSFIVPCGGRGKKKGNLTEKKNVGAFGTRYQKSAKTALSAKVRGEKLGGRGVKCWGRGEGHF